MVVAVALMVAVGVGPAQAPVGLEKVHPRVLDQAARGPVEFLVVLGEQADLSAAAGQPDSAARGRMVFETLTALASRTQAPLIEQLEERGVPYRSFWIANVLWVRGGLTEIEALAARADVLRIDGNPRIRLSEPAPEASAQPPQTTAAIEWNLLRIGADQAWAMGHDGTGVVVAGQDTGYDWDHPALIRQYRGWDGAQAEHDYNWHDAIHSGGGVCGADSPLPCDDSSHGTHTMGTMVGDDGGANRVGVSPGARWIGCRNMDQGFGTPATYTECFQWFVAPTNLSGQKPDPARAPHVINNSWTCPPFEGCAADTLELVVANTRAAGIVVVASAGNSGSSCSTVSDPPAIYAASFSVGATDSQDQIAGFSSRGPVTIDGSGRLKPDVSAPGVSVRSSVPGGGYGSASGTSMAGPHVAGLVALLLDGHPDLAGDVEQIESLIEQTALPLTSTQTCGETSGLQSPNNTFGYGRIDAVELLAGDTDDDGTPNVEDCRPLSGGTWAAPEPVGDLLLASAHDTTLLDWSEPVAPGGEAPAYDVLRSDRAGDFSKAVCLEQPTGSLSASDATTPKTIFYYVVRIRNACGTQMGTSSAGAPRNGAICFEAP